MRLHQLGLPFDRDGYDEGVYWQSLLALSDGHSLYSQVFYSQPPLFLWSLFPLFEFFGGTIWAARLSIAIISLMGLVGAFLLGNALSGRSGAIAALLLLLVNPLYLAQSQTLQAEAPSIALAFLAVGLTYLWWEKADDAGNCWLAVLAAIAMMCSISSKLLGLSALIPIGLLILARIYRVVRRPPGTRIRSAYSLFAGMVAFILTGALMLIPLSGTWAQFWAGVVTMHTASGILFQSTQQVNLSMMQSIFVSITAIVALYGTSAAVLRRDWRVFPLIAWFFSTVFMLYNIVPLFHHHLVALIPPLIGLAVSGIAPIDWQKSMQSLHLNTRTMICYFLIGAAVVINSGQVLRYYHHGRVRVANDSDVKQLVIKDLQDHVNPDQLVITDAQFLAGVAGRRTPASLVDTSFVRIKTEHLTSEQLISQASRTEVRAILLYSGRLKLSSLAAFHSWMSAHYCLMRKYGNGRELWIRCP